MRLRAGAVTSVLFVLLQACSRGPERQPAAGEAYAGPVELQVRDALVARARVSDTIRHGERVEILGRRRSFYRIRTERGREGWVDGRQLLSGQQMAALRRLAGRAADSPSQGRATVLDELNVHTAPHRQAPSFRRIQPKELVDVIAYERVPRKPYAPQPLLRKSANSGNGVARPQKRTDRGKQQPVPLAPVPVPAPPPNWMDLSRTARISEQGALSPPVQAPAPPVVSDEWALVRLKDGAAGWVLARMLFQAIPDEVAQYAERARIMAYFQIGAVRTKDGQKPVWLWAAQSQRAADFDFDSLRIFVWSARRSRYETSFIERNLKGRLPLLLRESSSGVEGFDVEVEEKDGQKALRSYRLAEGTFRARLVSKSPVEARPSWLEDGPAEVPAGEPANAGERGRLARVGRWLEGLKARFSR